MSIYRIARALPFSGLFRQLEKEAETVISVLQPGPLGIIEHKFTPQEIRQAKATVFSAVENWRRHSKLDHANGVLNDFIYKCPSFQATVDSPHKFQAQKIVSEILFCLYDLESIEQMSV